MADPMKIKGNLLVEGGMLTVAGTQVSTPAATETLTNKTINADNNTISNIANANIKANAAIDATKIADGSVTNAEFQYLGGVTSDIQTQLDGKAATVHTHVISDVTGLQDALDAKIDDAEKGAPNGVATLNADGKLAASQVPSIAITDTFVVASEAAMLALSTAEQGDVAVRTDIQKTFILVSGSPATLANWQELLSPTDAVQSVNGQTGTVVLDTDDINEGATNLYFTDTRAKTAAVVNSTAGNETDQAASVSAMKTYVTGITGGLPQASAGDIDETLFSLSNNQSLSADVTGLAFSNAVVRSFKALVSVEIDATAGLYESFELLGVQKASGWNMAVTATGDDSLVAFTITSAGQVQYVSANYPGFVSGKIKFRAITTSV